jgi:hypothetical protein
MEPMLPVTPPSDPIWAVAVAAIYFGSFILIGWLARLLLDKLMQRSGAHLEDVHALAGRKRGKRTVFLLGAWRQEND